MRLAGLSLALWLAAVPVLGQEITAAEYSEPTTRYPHGVLGNDEEWGTLRITVSRKRGAEDALFNGFLELTYEIVLPKELVFEDTAPRLWDVTGDGAPEVVVVQSHAEEGARLLVIGLVEGKPGFLAATPFIGTRNRWLAPVGVADLDGDGKIEIAYVDRPHLENTLRIWRFADGALRHVADGRGDTLPGSNGLSNHQQGWDFIAGGIADCGAGPVIFTANGDWSLVMASTLRDGAVLSAPVGTYGDVASLERFLTCP